MSQPRCCLLYASGICPPHENAALRALVKELADALDNCRDQGSDRDALLTRAREVAK